VSWGRGSGVRRRRRRTSRAGRCRRVGGAPTPVFRSHRKRSPFWRRGDPSVKPPEQAISSSGEPSGASRKT
jgi:hypothetical protein